MMRAILFTITIMLSPLAIADNAVNPNTVNAQAASSNPASDTICQIILIVNGRLGRVIAAAGIFVIGFLFLLGKVTWPKVVITCVGIALLFAAKTVVVALLPSRIVTYNTHTAQTSVSTPENVIRSACSELA